MGFVHQSTQGGNPVQCHMVGYCSLHSSDMDSSQCSVVGMMNADYVHVNDLLGSPTKKSTQNENLPPKKKKKKKQKKKKQKRQFLKYKRKL